MIFSALILICEARQSGAESRLPHVLAAQHVRDGAYRLYSAVKRGNLQQVRHLLNDGVPIESEWTDRETVLMRAATDGNLKMVKYLVQRGANPNSIDDFGLSALGLAALMDHRPVLRYLLRKGANPNGAPHGVPPLVAAADHAYPAALEILLAAHANPNAKDTLRRDTALIRAVLRNSSKCVAVLLHYGADPKIRGREGDTAVQLAAKLGRTRISALFRSYR